MDKNKTLGRYLEMASEKEKRKWYFNSDEIINV